MNKIIITIEKTYTDKQFPFYFHPEHGRVYLDDSDFDELKDACDVKIDTDAVHEQFINDIAVGNFFIETRVENNDLSKM